jgi:hypothetical protein
MQRHCKHAFATREEAMFSVGQPSGYIMRSHAARTKIGSRSGDGSQRWLRKNGKKGIKTKITTPEISLHTEGFSFVQLPTQGMTHPRRCFIQILPQKFKSQLIVMIHRFLGTWIRSQDFLGNASNHLPDCMISQPNRPQQTTNLLLVTQAYETQLLYCGVLPKSRTIWTRADAHC